MKTKTIILLLLTFYQAILFAQISNTITEEVPTMTVVDIDDFLAPTNGTLRMASESLANSLNVQNVKSLIYNTQPSIYYFSDVEKIFGEKPKNLFTNFNSLNNLNTAISLKNNIEIVTIKLENKNQLNSTFNLELFSSFKNLKYIYILSTFDTNAQAISNMIIGINEKYSVFYNVEKGDTN